LPKRSLAIRIWSVSHLAPMRSMELGLYVHDAAWGDTPAARMQTDNYKIARRHQKDCTSLWLDV
jgi:hypothetical protein